MSQSIVLYLHMHQPYRVRKYPVFDIGNESDYFNSSADDALNNELIFKKVAEKSYRPMNALLGRILQRQPDFKFSLSLTGTFVEQAQSWAPDLIDDIKNFVKTGRVELVDETYNHSLSFFYNKEVFEKEVKKHTQMLWDLFEYKPSTFRNTELSYNNDLALWAENHGYQNIITEGWDNILGWRSPNHVYKPTGTKNIKLLLKNYRLSDDIAFRFGDFSWKEWPLTAHKYARWANNNSAGSRVINLFMDFETFGEHQWEDTGIFDFFSNFVDIWLKTKGNDFETIRGATAKYPVEGEIDVPGILTWADQERDLSAWNGNSLQREALKEVYRLSDQVEQTAENSIKHDWENLLTSDHFYYMTTKSGGDGSVHSYFSPYSSPYTAFLNYQNAVRDIEYRLNQAKD